MLIYIFKGNLSPFDWQTVLSLIPDWLKPAAEYQASECKKFIALKTGH